MGADGAGASQSLCGGDLAREPLPAHGNRDALWSTWLHGWLKWPEPGGSRAVLRWVSDQSGGRWEWKPQYQALPSLGEVLSPRDSKFMARSHLSFSPSELLSPRKPTLLKLL